jgi:hypothetical protein
VYLLFTMRIVIAGCPWPRQVVFSSFVGKYGLGYIQFFTRERALKHLPNLSQKLLGSLLPPGKIVVGMGEFSLTTASTVA